MTGILGRTNSTPGKCLSQEWRSLKAIINLYSPACSTYADALQHRATTSVHGPMASYLTWLQWFNSFSFTCVCLYCKRGSETIYTWACFPPPWHRGSRGLPTDSLDLKCLLFSTAISSWIAYQSDRWVVCSPTNWALDCFLVLKQTKGERKEKKSART